MYDCYKLLKQLSANLLYQARFSVGVSICPAETVRERLLIVSVIEVIVGYQLRFNMLCCVIQGFQELVQIFLVQENLVFFIEVPILFKLLPTFRNREIVVVGTRSLDIEKISSLTRFDSLRINLVVFFILFHSFNLKILGYITIHAIHELRSFKDVKQVKET